MTALRTKSVPLAKIKPYAKNAKKHPAKQVRQIANSINEFGFNQPIVVDKKGVIIVGHGRYEAAKILEMKNVPVLEVELSEEKAAAYRLADNKLNESEWDMDLVIAELQGLSEKMFDFTGFDKDLLVQGDEKDDEIPADPPPTRETRRSVGFGRAPGAMWRLDQQRRCGAINGRQESGNGFH